MVTFRFVRQSVLVLCLSMIAAVVFAQGQSASSEFVPMEGQAGKDVIWLPTSQSLVDKMLDLAKVTPQDFVIDLGSGDGRTVITAAKRGARALGIEYNPDMVELSKRNAAKEGVADTTQFIKADLFESDFSKATVITMFLLTDINLKLRPQILNLNPEPVSCPTPSGWESGNLMRPKAWNRGRTAITTALPFSGLFLQRSKAHGSSPRDNWRSSKASR
jgi:SAM-dependent methyltransferase